jgi:hypothetical protein
MWVLRIGGGCWFWLFLILAVPDSGLDDPGYGPERRDGKNCFN